MKTCPISWLFVVLAFGGAALVGVRSAEAPPPGIAVRLNQNFFEYGAKVGAELIKKRISSNNIPVPDHNGTLSVKICDITYYLSSIRLVKVKNIVMSIKVVPDVGVTVFVENADLYFVGKFRYTYSLFMMTNKNGGTFDLALTKTSITVKLTAGMEPSGTPKVELLGCNTVIGQIKLQLYAFSANWLLERFTSTIESAVKPTLEMEICEYVKNTRASLAKKLAENTNVAITKSKTLYVNLGLTAPPTFGDSFLETKHKGEVTWANDTRRVKYFPPRFTSMPTSPKMICAYLSKYVVNTMLFAMYNNKNLSAVFTQKDFAYKNRNLLDTNCKDNPLCFSAMVPGLSAAYPNQAVEFEANATEVPVMDVSNGTFAVTYGTRLGIRVRDAKGKVTTIGEYSVSGNATGVLRIKGDKLYLTVTSIRLNKASVADKTVPKEPLNKLKDIQVFLQEITDKYLMLRLNELGTKGFPMVIPVKGLMLSEPSLLTYEKSGYLMCVDVVYL